MKIEFEDKSGYIEIKMDNRNVVIIIQAVDQNNKKQILTSCAEITTEQFRQLISGM